MLLPFAGARSNGIAIGVFGQSGKRTTQVEHIASASSLQAQQLEAALQQIELLGAGFNVVLEAMRCDEPLRLTMSSPGLVPKSRSYRASGQDSDRQKVGPACVRALS